MVYSFSYYKTCWEGPCIKFMEEEISLVELFDILKKHLNLIIVTTIATTVIAALYTFFLVTPMYQSSTQMLVTQSSSENASVTQSDINTSISLINTYEDVIRNDVILNPVIEELELDTTPGLLREQISVQTGNNSQVFSIAVEDENPYRAAEIANTTADIFQTEIFDIMNVDNVTIISAANPNLNQASPNNILNIVIGFMLGAMLGIGLVFIRELTDNTVKSAEYVEDATGWANLGHVNVFTKQDLVVKTPLPKQQIQPKEETKKEMTRLRRRV